MTLARPDELALEDVVRELAQQLASRPPPSSPWQQLCRLVTQPLPARRLVSLQPTQQPGRLVAAQKGKEGIAQEENGFEYQEEIRLFILIKWQYIRA